MGKDGRAISVSGYVHTEKVKYTEYAFDKIVDYKQRSLNHLVHQAERFRMGIGRRWFKLPPLRSATILHGTTASRAAVPPPCGRAILRMDVGAANFSK